jgi:hypothetical protein
VVTWAVLKRQRNFKANLDSANLLPYRFVLWPGGKLTSQKIFRADDDLFSLWHRESFLTAQQFPALNVVISAELKDFTLCS